MNLRIDAGNGDRYRIALRYTSRKQRRQARIAGWAVIAIGVVLLLTPGVLGPSVIPALRAGYRTLGVVLILAGCLPAIFPIRYRVDHLLATTSCSFELTDERLRQISPLHSLEMSWDAVARFQEIPGQMLIFTSRTQFISVPLAELTEGQLAELRQFIAARSTSRPAGAVR